MPPKARPIPPRLLMNNDLYYGIVKHLATGKVLDNIDKETQCMVKKVSDLYTLDKNKLYNTLPRVLDHLTDRGTPF